MTLPPALRRTSSAPRTSPTSTRRSAASWPSSSPARWRRPVASRASLPIRLDASRRLTSQICCQHLADNEFKGKAGSSAVARLGGKARRVGIVGLGPAAKHTPRAWKLFGSAAAGAAKAAKASSLALAVVGAPAMDAAAAADAVEVRALGHSRAGCHRKASRFLLPRRDTLIR